MHEGMLAEGISEGGKPVIKMLLRQPDTARVL